MTTRFTQGERVRIIDCPEELRANGYDNGDEVTILRDDAVVVNGKRLVAIREWKNKDAAFYAHRFASIEQPAVRELRNVRAELAGIDVLIGKAPNGRLARVAELAAAERELKNVRSAIVEFKGELHDLLDGL